MTKYLNIIRNTFNNYDYPVFTITDIRVLLSNTQISPGYLKILINNLLKTKEITKVTKGAYTFHKDSAVVGFAFRPFYYGMEDALSYRNLWTQATNPIVMTTNGAREGLRKLGNSNYIVKRVKPEFFFGFNFIRHYDMWIPVSDSEKTLIDLLYYRHGVRRDALEPLLNTVDKDKLEEYLKAYSRNFRKKILTYLAVEGSSYQRITASSGIPYGHGGI